MAEVWGVDPSDLRRAAGSDRVRRAETAGGVGTSPLALARLAVGLTQPQLAARVNVSVATISRWECGLRAPHAEDLLRLAPVLQLEVGALHSMLIGGPTRQRNGVGRLRGLASAWAAAGLDARQVADALGLDETLVREWGAGRRSVPHPVWSAIAALLSLEIDDGLRSVRRRPPLTEPSLLASARKTRGLTQRELGDALGVAPSTIGTWERRIRIPSRAQIARLARLVACDAGQLATDLTGDPPPVTADPGRTPDDLPGLLVALRRASGLRRDQVSRCVGVASSTVRRWESGGTRPSPLHLGRLAILYDVDPCRFTSPPTLSTTTPPTNGRSHV